jgi:hypothetical protein
VNLHQTGVQVTGLIQHNAEHSAVNTVHLLLLQQQQQQQQQQHCIMLSARAVAACCWQLRPHMMLFAL